MKSYFLFALLLFSFALKAQKNTPSLKALQEKINQSQQAADWLHYAENLLLLGTFYEQKNQLDSAKAAWSRVLEIKQAKEDKKIQIVQAKALDELMVEAQEAYQIPTAIELVQQAIELRKNLDGEALLLAENYRKLGICHFINRDMEQGLPFVYKALDIYKTQGNKVLDDDWFRLYNTLGGAYGTLGDLKQSNDNLDKALEYCLKVFGPNHPKTATIYDNISKNYIDMDKPEEGVHFFDLALKYALKAYGINKGAGDLYQAARNSVYIGQLYVHHSDFELALDWYNDNIPLLKQVFGEKHPEVGLAYFEISKVYYRYEQTLENVKKSMYYANKAVLALLPLYNDSLAQENPRIVPTFYQENWFHDYYLMNSLSHKSNTFFNLYKHSKNIEDVLIAVEHLDSLYMLCEKRAIDAFNNKDALYDLKDQYYAFGTIVESCAELYEHYKEEKYWEKAFLYSERIKGFSMKNATQTQDALSFGGVPDSVVLQLQTLKDEIADLNYQKTDARLNKQSKAELEMNSLLASKNENYQNLIELLKKDYPNYHSYRYNNQYVTIKEVQEKLLDDETLLIEYSTRELQFAVIGISKNKVSLDFKEYEERSQQEKDAEALYQALSNYDLIKENPEKNFKDYCRAAHLFYKRYVELVLQQHPNKKKLIIIADGYFSRIPFDALLTKNVDNEKVIAYDKLSYLIKEYSIQYGYSASLLVENQKQTKNNQTLDGILGIAGSYQKNMVDTALLASRSASIRSLREVMSDLPGAKAEVEALEWLYTGQYFYGLDANEKNFKTALSQPRSVIHLAMHGFMDTRESLLSCLLFTDNGDSTSDNNLYAGEITQLKLKTNLVVLSACETADGEWAKAEGIMSLGRSFMYAGVPAVVMSLWQVNDQSTSIIMKEFYANLAQGQTKSKALQQAKLSYIQHATGLACHPAFWAAFISLGDDAPIHISAKWNRWYWGLGILGMVVLGGFYFFRKRE